MSLNKVFSYRLEPSKDQLQKIAQSAGCTRYIFNYGLSKVKNALDNKVKNLHIKI